MLILVRHGRTSANAGGRLQGRVDNPLDELGRAQAMAIAAAMDPPDRLISSPLRRALDTAAAMGGEISADEMWLERDFGELDGRVSAELPDELRRVWTDAEFVPPGGESLSAVSSRVEQACEALVGEAAESTIVVVTHMTPIKAAMAWSVGAGVGVAMRTHLDPASITRIGVRGGRPLLVSFNETGHLADLAWAGSTRPV